MRYLRNRYFNKCRILALLGLSLCLLQTSFAICQDSANKIDVLESTGIPAQVLNMIIPQIAKMTGSAKFEFQIRDKDKSPLAGEALQLSWKDGKKELKTDASGKITIGISPENIKGLQLEIPAGATCELIDSPIRTAGPGGPPPGAKMVPLDGSMFPEGAKIMKGTPGEFPEGMRNGFKRMGGSAGKGAKRMGPGSVADLFSTELVGKDAPEIKLEDLSGAPKGTEVSIESLHGKVTVLEFWATWCKPCIMGFPHLNELDEELGDDFVFLSITDEDRETIKETLEKYPLNTWVGMDTDGSVFEAYDIKARPTAVIIDKDGIVVAVTGAQMVSAKALKDVAEGKSWPKGSEITADMLGDSDPIDVSPEDITSDYEITADDLMPGMAEGFVGLLDQIAQMQEEMGEEVSGEIPIQLAIHDSDGNSKTGFSLKLVEGERKTTVTTNYLGNVTVGITRENHKNLRLLVPAGHRVIKPDGNRIMGSSSMRRMGGGEVTELDASNLESLTSSDNALEVLYPKGEKAKAQEYVECLVAIKKSAEALCGIELDRDYGVALHNIPEGGGITVKGTARFPMRLDNDLNENTLINWVMNHEWVEGTLVTKYGLNYQADSNLRFIGDGLAELTSYQFCLNKRLNTNEILEKYKSRIQQLLDEGVTQFDLLKDFPVERGMIDITSKKAAGYAMSFLYWHQIKEKADAETIQRFINHMKEHGMAAADVQTALKQISGREFSTKMDLKQCLAQLDRLIEK